MCGRYTLYRTKQLGRRYRVPIEEPIDPNYNVAPTQTMPVITEEGLKLMRWGLIPTWAKDEKIGYRLINARSESVFEKPMWKGIIKRKRCLIPADGFYEWQKREDGKQPYYIHPTDQEIFSFAGLWDTWHHNGKEWHTYSILTTEPNDEMAPIHDRMPVILAPEDEDEWLHDDDEAAIRALLAPYSDGKLETYEVSKAVNVTKANDETLIGPINSK